MRRPFVRLATTVVRGWTWFYTRGLPPAERDRRIEEIESDIWESTRDRAALDRWVSLRMFARLVTGVPDDLGWRAEREGTMKRWPTVRVALVTGIGGIVTWALAIVVGVNDPPSVPGAPQSAVPALSSYPAPPPPPAPPGTDEASVDRRAVYARTSYAVIDGPSRGRLVKDVPPVYPPIAIGAGLGGVVRLEATVDPNGRVASTRIVQPVWLLSQSAIDAIKQWQFEPSHDRSVIAVTVAFTPPTGGV